MVPVAVMAGGGGAVVSAGALVIVGVVPVVGGRARVMMQVATRVVGDHFEGVDVGAAVAAAWGELEGLHGVFEFVEGLPAEGTVSWLGVRGRRVAGSAAVIHDGEVVCARLGAPVLT